MARAWQSRRRSRRRGRSPSTMSGTARCTNIWEPDLGATSKDSRRQHLRPSSKTGNKQYTSAKPPAGAIDRKDAPRLVVKRELTLLTYENRHWHEPGERPYGTFAKAAPLGKCYRAASAYDVSGQRMRNCVLFEGVTGFSECGVAFGTKSYGTGCAR
jgi:hypothetical protein